MPIAQKNLTTTTLAITETARTLRNLLLCDGDDVDLDVIELHKAVSMRVLQAKQNNI